MSPHLQSFIDECRVKARDVHERGRMLEDGYTALAAELQAVGKEAGLDLDVLIQERRDRKEKEAAAIRLEGQLYGEKLARETPF